MRFVLPVLALAGALSPLPAFAAEGDAARMAEELSDPARQQQIAAAIEAMTATMLEMPAAPLLRAAATMAGKDAEDIGPDVSVGDLMGPEAAAAPRELVDRLPAMMSAMAIFATSFEAMLPELRAMGDRMAEDMAKEAPEGS